MDITIWRGVGFAIPIALVLGMSFVGNTFKGMKTNTQSYTMGMAGLLYILNEAQFIQIPGLDSLVMGSFVAGSAIAVRIASYLTQRRVDKDDA